MTKSPKSNVSKEIKGNVKRKSIVPRGQNSDKFDKKRWDNEIDIRNLADETLKEYAESGLIWLKDIFIKRFISRKQIMNMNKRSEYFNESYAMMKDIQESRLANAMLDGSSNVAAVKFALKNVAAWAEEVKPEPDDDIPETAGFEFKAI